MFGSCSYNIYIFIQYILLGVLIDENISQAKFTSTVFQLCILIDGVHLNNDLFNIRNPTFERNWGIMMKTEH